MIFEKYSLLLWKICSKFLIEVSLERHSKVKRPVGTLAWLEQQAVEKSKQIDKIICKEQKVVTPLDRCAVT